MWWVPEGGVAGDVSCGWPGRAGYNGAIDYDHIMQLTTDSPVGREYIAFCVGHSRGMLQALVNE
jgi:hypothetical protein